MRHSSSKSTSAPWWHKGVCKGGGGGAPELVCSMVQDARRASGRNTQLSDVATLSPKAPFRPGSGPAAAPMSSCLCGRCMLRKKSSVICSGGVAEGQGEPKVGRSLQRE